MDVVKERREKWRVIAMEKTGSLAGKGNDRSGGRKSPKGRPRC